MRFQLNTGESSLLPRIYCKVNGCLASLKTALSETVEELH